MPVVESSSANCAAHATWLARSTTRDLALDHPQAKGRIGLVLGGGAIGANLGRIDEARVPLDRAATLAQELTRHAPAEAEWVHELARDRVLAGER